MGSPRKTEVGCVGLYWFLPWSLAVLLWVFCVMGWIGSPQKVCWGSNPPYSEYDLIWKHGHCRCGDWRWGHTGVGWIFSPTCVLKSREKFGPRHGHREDQHVEMRQRWEWCSHKPRNAWGCQKQGGREGSSPRGSWGSWPCQHLVLTPLLSRAVRKWISGVLSHPVCGTLLCRPWETSRCCILLEWALYLLMRLSPSKGLDPDISLQWHHRTEEHIELCHKWVSSRGQAG